MTKIERIIKELNSKQGKENLERGYDFERRIMNKYKNRSDVLFAFNSKGSRGFADVIVQFKSGKQFLISCKVNGYLTRKEQEQLKKMRGHLLENQRIKVAHYVSCKKYVVVDF